MSDLKVFHYDAFISYRHSDIDSFVAQNLHRKLENFKLPKSVLPKVQNGKKKIERIFRDVDELPLSEDLSDPISKALLNSDYLITICTPRYPQSRWCMKEIEVFLQTHPRDHILVVLAEDEPDNSFPEILKYEDVKVTDENGQVHITRKEIEPLAADTRGSSKKEILKAMDIAVIKLCAAMFGLNYDDLKQRHREQKIRRLTALFGSIGAAVLAFAIFATVMLIKISRQNVTISNQYNELQDSFAATMAGVSDNLYEDGRRKDAVYAVRSVLSDDAEGDYNVKAVKALYDAMEVYKLSPLYTPYCTYDADTWLYYFGVSADQKYAFANAGSDVYLCDCDSGEVLDILSDADGIVVSSAFCGSDGLIYTDGDEYYYYSIDTKDKTKLDIPEYSNLYPSEDGNCVITYGTDNILCGIGSTGEMIFETDLNEYFDGESKYLEDVTFTKDSIVCPFWDGSQADILIFDALDGTLNICYSVESAAEPSAKLDGNILYTIVSAHDEDSGDWTSEIAASDILEKEDLWSLKLDGIEPESGEFFIADDYLFFQSADEIIVIDPIEGDLIKRYTCTRPIMEAWISEDPDYGSYLFFLLSDGSVYKCDGYFQTEETEFFFGIAPTETITQAEFIGDNLYCILGSENYAIRYSKDISLLATPLDDDVYWEQTEDLYPPDVFDDTDKFDVNVNQVDFTCYSDDQEYIFALFSDHTARLYDAETGTCVNSFETDLERVDLFNFSDATGSYIISGYNVAGGISFILDGEMQVICEADFIVAEEGDDFIMMDNDAALYKVPYIDVPSLLEMADEYLGGYKPPKSVKDKYGVS